MLTLVTPPASEPVSLAEAKLHLRVDFDDDDALIAALITAARQKCESYLDRSFLTTAWLQTLDGFPGQFSRFGPAGILPLLGQTPERYFTGTGLPIVVPKARLIAVQSLSYVDQAGDVQTLDPAAYSVEAGDGGRIARAYNLSWPVARAYPGSVTIALTVGYGGTAADVPETIKAAIKLYVGHLYANRQAVVATPGIVAVELPMAVKWLLASEDWGCR